jgi:hypothetical protein
MAMSDLRKIGGELANLAWVAARSFVGTVLVLTAAGVLLAVVSYYVLRDDLPYAAIAGAVALAEGIAAGIVLGVKRGLVLALTHGVRRLGLGRSMVRLVFERLLGVSADQEFGDRGGRLARGFERLPLAQAEDRLTRAVTGLVGAPLEGGQDSYLRRRLRATLLRPVQTYTLARFRAEGVRHGGVDLVKAQADLDGQIDDLLLATLRGGLTLWTVAVALLLPVVVAAQTYVLIGLLGR